MIASMNVHFVDASNVEYTYENADGEQVAPIPQKFSVRIWTFESSMQDLMDDFIIALRAARNGHTTFVYLDGEWHQDSQSLTVNVTGSFITPRAQEYVPTT